MESAINQAGQIIEYLENKAEEFDKVLQDIIEELRRAFDAHIAGNRDKACDHIYCAAALYKAAPNIRKNLAEIKEQNQDFKECV